MVSFGLWFCLHVHRLGEFRGLYVEPVARQADYRLEKIWPETVVRNRVRALAARLDKKRETMLHHIACAPVCHGRVSKPPFQAGYSLSPFELVGTGDGRAHAAAEACDAAAGLVSFSTSVRGGADSFPKLEVDRLKSRLSRMSSGVLTATRLIDAEWTASKIRFHRYMLTLTYRPGELWSPRHISDCLKKYRNWADKLGFKLSYVWVSEVQQSRYQRGSLLGECVHYHLLIWVSVRFVPPMADKQGWWIYGMSNRVRVSRPVKYMMKYASKGQSVVFPKGLRIHGCGGLAESSRNERRWWLMPRWVRVIFSIDDLPFRCPGGGIVSRLTGEWLPSIWRIYFEGSRVFVSLRDDLLDFFSVGRVRQLIEQGVI